MDFEAFKAKLAAEGWVDGFPPGTTEAQKADLREHMKARLANRKEVTAEGLLKGAAMAAVAIPVCAAASLVAASGEPYGQITGGSC